MEAEVSAAPVVNAPVRGLNPIATVAEEAIWVPSADNVTVQLVRETDEA